LGNAKRFLRFLLGDKIEEHVKEGEIEPEEKVKNENSEENSVWETAKGFARGFGIGLGAKGALAIVSTAFSKRIYDPKQLMQAGFGKPSIKFALFLGSFVGAWKGVNYFMQWLRGKDDGINSLIAGGVAGSSIAFSRSTELSMYFFSKAIEAIFCHGVDNGVVRTIPQGDVLVFILSSAIIFYCSVMEPYSLRPSMFQFLNRCGNGKYSQFEPLIKNYHPEFVEATNFKYSM